MTESSRPETTWSIDSLPVLTDVVDNPDAPALEVPVFDFSTELDELARALPSEEPVIELPPELTLDDVLGEDDQPSGSSVDAGELIRRLPSLDLEVDLPDELSLDDVLPGLRGAEVADQPADPVDADDFAFELDPDGSSVTPAADGLGGLFARATLVPHERSSPFVEDAVSVATLAGQLDAFDLPAELPDLPAGAFLDGEPAAEADQTVFAADEADPVWSEQWQPEKSAEETDQAAEMAALLDAIPATGIRQDAVMPEPTLIPVLQALPDAEEVPAAGSPAPEAQEFPSVAEPVNMPPEAVAVMGTDEQSRDAEIIAPFGQDAEREGDRTNGADLALDEPLDTVGADFAVPASDSQFAAEQAWASPEVFDTVQGRDVAAASDNALGHDGMITPETMSLDQPNPLSAESYTPMPAEPWSAAEPSPQLAHSVEDILAALQPMPTETLPTVDLEVSPVTEGEKAGLGGDIPHTVPVDGMMPDGDAPCDLWPDAPEADPDAILSEPVEPLAGAEPLVVLADQELSDELVSVHDLAANIGGECEHAKAHDAFDAAADSHRLPTLDEQVGEQAPLAGAAGHAGVIDETVVAADESVDTLVSEPLGPEVAEGLAHKPGQSVSSDWPWPLTSSASAGAASSLQSISIDSLPTGVLGGGVGLAADHTNGPAFDKAPATSASALSLRQADEVERAWARDLGAELPRPAAEVAELVQHFAEPEPLEAQVLRQRRPTPAMSVSVEPVVAEAPLEEVAVSAPVDEMPVPVALDLAPPVESAPVSNGAAGVAHREMVIAGISELRLPSPVPQLAVAPLGGLDEDQLLQSLYARVLPRMKVELTLWMQDALEQQARQLMAGVMQQLKEDFDMMLGESLRSALQEAIDEAAHPESKEQ